jgi:hypothetical protein
MAEFNLPLTAEERIVLFRILDTALRETRVEVHHTHFSPEFREQVKAEEVLLRGLLAKLRSAPAAGGAT